MCWRCLPVTLPCSGAPLPYSTASPSRGFPYFCGTIKALRLPCRLCARLVCSQRALPASVCLFRSWSAADALPTPGRCYAGCVLFRLPVSAASTRISRVRGRPFMDLLCSWTPAEPLRQAIPAFGVALTLTNGWGFRVIVHFGGRSQGPSICCVCFAPVSPLTAQHSLPVDGQSFPGRFLIRRGLSNSFRCLLAPP